MPLDPSTGLETIPGDSSPNVITPDQYAASLVNVHGKIQGQPTIVNPYLTDALTGQRYPNPHPVTRYTYADGRFVDLETQQDGSYGIVRGTAVAVPGGGSNRAQLYKDSAGVEWRLNPDGSQTQLSDAKVQQPVIRYDAATGSYLSIDPTTGVATPVAGSQGGIDTQQPDPMNPGRTVTTTQSIPAYDAETRRQQALTAMLTLRQSQYQYRVDQIDKNARLTIAEKVQAVDELYKQTDLQIKQDANDITRRGQDLSFASQQASDASANARTNAASWEPAGTGAALNQAAARYGVPALPTSTTPPIDPNLAKNIAYAAVAHLSPIAAAHLQSLQQVQQRGANAGFVVPNLEANAGGSTLPPVAPTSAATAGQPPINPANPQIQAPTFGRPWGSGN